MIYRFDFGCVCRFTCTTHIHLAYVSDHEMIDNVMATLKSLLTMTALAHSVLHMKIENVSSDIYFSNSFSHNQIYSNCIIFFIVFLCFSLQLYYLYVFHAVSVFI